MKSWDYEKSYKYGYKIGAYKASCKINMNLFREIFKEEFKAERKRIKWLCYYELELLLDEFYECFRYRKEMDNENSKEEFLKSKARILKLLR
jgi:hypothetical protein